jgi:hypothetical protein
LVPDDVSSKSAAMALPPYVSGPKDGGKLAGSVARRLQMMIAGDSSLARHRMLRHLQGIGSYLQERWPG